MLKPVGSGGFTLIELLIGISIIAVLLALGAPPMSAYLQNSKIGGAAANVAAGLQMARTEAIRRNTPVEFVLTNASPAASNVANTATPALNGQNWIVRAVSGAAFEYIEGRPAAEGAGGAAAVQLAASGAASVQFTPLGATAGNAGFSVDITNPAGGTCAEIAGPMRCRRVVVNGGGRVQTCDPAAVAGDSRAC